MTDSIDPLDPPPPLPATGREGEPGEQPKGLRGGAGGTGGKGGRGGIGLTGPRGRPGKDAEPGDGERGRTGATGPQGPVGDLTSKFEKRLMGLLVLVVALSAIYFSTAAQHRLDDANDAQDRFDEQVACQQALVSSTIYALKARSGFAEQQAHVNLQLLRAQAHYLEAVADPAITRPQAYAALAAYRKALTFNIIATHDQLKVRDANPYPAAKDVEACR